MNAMATLAQEQQALLRALMGDGDDSNLWPHLQLAHAPLARRGLLAYQANGAKFSSPISCASTG